MPKEKISRNLAQISLLVPKIFLDRFDEATEELFPSRSEAIRRGMNLVLREAEPATSRRGET